jgi:hypothetical protein
VTWTRVTKSFHFYVGCLDLNKYLIFYTTCQDEFMPDVRKKNAGGGIWTPVYRRDNNWHLVKIREKRNNFLFVFLSCIVCINILSMIFKHDKHDFEVLLLRRSTFTCFIDVMHCYASLLCVRKRFKYGSYIQV